MKNYNEYTAVELRKMVVEAGEKWAVARKMKKAELVAYMENLAQTAPVPAPDTEPKEPDQTTPEAVSGDTDEAEEWGDVEEDTEVGESTENAKDAQESAEDMQDGQAEESAVVDSGEPQDEDSDGADGAEPVAPVRFGNAIGTTVDKAAVRDAMEARRGRPGTYDKFGVKILTPEEIAVREQRFTEMPLEKCMGTLVAFRSATGKVKSAKVINRSTKVKRFMVETRYGKQIKVRFQDVLWMRQMEGRWPNSILALLKGKIPEVNPEGWEAEASSGTEASEG